MTLSTIAAKNRLPIFGQNEQIEQPVKPKIKLTTARKNTRVLGGYGKAIETGWSLNYSRSATSNCDDGCTHKGTTCYAERNESRFDRKQLAAKLLRHEEMNPSHLTTLAINDLYYLDSVGHRPDWLRISTNGSVPQPRVACRNKSFLQQFEQLLRLCKDWSIPVHFPIETRRKADWYRERFGSLVVVRESVTSLRRFLRCENDCSFVAGSKDMSRDERLTYARQIAKQHYELTGRRTIVCPAVSHTYGVLAGRLPKGPNRAKCGNCTRCADTGFDIVYPLH